MIDSTDFQIVDSTGRAHHTGLTAGQADGLMKLMLASGKFAALRIERMGAAIAPVAATQAPPIVAIASPTPLPGGDVRQALRTAIEARDEAARRLADASNAVGRATTHQDEQKASHAAATVSHEAAVRAAGATLAATFKAGDALPASRAAIDRAELANAESRLSAASAALDMLQAEHAEAERQLETAEAAVTAAVLAVKRAEVEVLVGRLEGLKAEFIELAGRVDGAGFAGVVLNARAQAALHCEANAGDASAHAARWHSYTRTLRENADAAWEAQ
ncbi:hypothetical protein [Ralstonia pickettii]|jgi:hypothetical protein|uniref:hypothetical protein n=1 Tax=Ralstonia pickettii TaxID=329 RepID=UPI0004080EB0|nr:hypothetical protein [Ralstonia pickettii]OCS50798.1 hypothetical protein BEK68_09670 [Ralstonia pickettii]